MAKGTETRTRILNIAQEAVLAKGFGATSIEEIVAAAEITKGGFFYHFSDKNALALALIQRYIQVEDQILDDLERRARQLTDDPLQMYLVSLKLLEELLHDMPSGHPGCLIATTVYQDQLFDRDVRDLNKMAMLSWRHRFRKLLDEIAKIYPPREDVSMTDVSDMLSSAVEGGIVLSKSTNDPGVVARQVGMYRSYIKLLFSPTRN